jgi:hypothetical protein
MSEKTEPKPPTELPPEHPTKKDDLLRVPDHVLITKVVPYFGFKDYALLSTASQYLQAHWQEAQQKNPMPLYVPEDCATLNKAVERVHGDPRITTIVVGEGVHQIDGRYLWISSAMKIVGRPDVPKEEIVIVGGIDFKKGIGMCHLQHLTLRQAKRCGVWGESSFMMEDVIVEQCGYGVCAVGTVVSRCTNVEVRQCTGIGVLASQGASITLIGPKTKVHGNCTNGGSDQYGLKVYSASSTIQLVAPLTKEEVSVNNGGGGNWGASFMNGNIDQIKNIEAIGPADESPGETKYFQQIGIQLRF